MGLSKEQINRLMAIRELVTIENGVLKLKDLSIVEKMLEYSQKMEESIKLLNEKIKEMDSRSEVVINNITNTVENKLAEIKDGDNYVLNEEDKKEIAGMIEPPVMEKVIEKTKIVREQPIDRTVTIVKEVAVTEPADIIVEKINKSKNKINKNIIDFSDEELSDTIIKLIKKKKLLNSNDINGLEGFSRDGINYKFEELMHGGGSSTASITYSSDLSSQCDGNNKIFTIPTNSSIILLTGTDSPLIYKPTTDYTVSGTTLTLTSAVNAPSLGSTLIVTYTV